MKTEKTQREAVVLHRLVRWFLIIMGVVVATLNLTHLLPVNPEYEASWFKVAFAIGLAIFGANFHSSNTQSAGNPDENEHGN